MEVALRSRLDGVSNVAISQSEQKTTVEFAAGAGAFSPHTFREAVKQSDVEVLSMRVDACGVVEDHGGQRWLAAGSNRLLLEKAEAAPVGPIVCVSGTLDDRSEPYRLEVASIAGS
jgi:hypothetical protein